MSIPFHLSPTGSSLWEEIVLRRRILFPRSASFVARRKEPPPKPIEKITHRIYSIAIKTKNQKDRAGIEPAIRHTPRLIADPNGSVPRMLPCFLYTTDPVSMVSACKRVNKIYSDRFLDCPVRGRILGAFSRTIANHHQSEASMMRGKLDSLFRSRRLWIAAAGVAVVILKETMAIPLTEEQITQVVLLVGSWIVGESLRSSER